MPRCSGLTVVLLCGLIIIVYAFFFNIFWTLCLKKLSLFVIVHIFTKY